MSLTSQRVLDALGPGIVELAGPLFPVWLEALVAELEEMRYLLEPVEGRPGTPLSDLATTPHPAWLGQVIGARVPAGTPTELARAQVLARRPATRGRPAAIIAAVRAALGNPQATVLVTERTGSAYRFQVTTYQAETPDPSVVPPAIASEKPVGMIATHEVRRGATWDEVEDLGLTWATISAYTWDQVGLMVPPT